MAQHPAVIQSKKSGIALVIVLGFLALLVITAVSFTAMMRTERAAARSFQDGARARQLVYTGLTRAITDIDNDMEVNGRYYPAWDCTNSMPYGLSTDRIDLVVGEMTNFVPTAMQPYLAGSAQNCGWQNIYDPVVDPVTGKNKLLGRYSYLAVNCSGLLDLNYIGGNPRLDGRDPAEIVLNTNFLTELSGTAWSTLPPERSNVWIRAESLPDLWVACSAYAGYMPRRPNNTFMYSYAPRGYWSEAVQSVLDPVYIGGSADQILIDRGPIKDLFTKMGILEADKLVDNLADFVDDDLFPRDYQSFCTEPIPMINEIVVSNRVQNYGGDVSNAFQVSVELYYPFGGYANTHQYALTLLATYEGASPAGLNPGRIAVASYNIPVASWTYPTYYVYNSPMSLASVVAPPSPNLGAIKVTVRAQLRDAGNIVDDSGTHDFFFSFIPFPAANTTSNAISDHSADDPRLNWDPKNPHQWISTPNGSVTLGSFNTNVSTLVSNPNSDGTSVMFVANANITAVGELGYLLYSSTNPWHTISLLGADALPVLSWFTAHTNEVRKGLVNINSIQRDALADVLSGASPNRWHTANTPGLTVAELQTLAQNIINTRGQFGQFTNVSDIARLGNDPTNWPGNYDKIQKESIIRNTADLLTTRQNIFTIFVGAESVQDNNGDGTVQASEVVAQQRGVAVVWRDPYKNPATGVHDTFVRFYASKQND